MLFALDFNLICCNMAEFLKPGDAAEMTTADKAEIENSDGDSGGGLGTVCRLTTGPTGKFLVFLFEDSFLCFLQFLD